MRVFEERFKVEHLSHSMNPEFIIRFSWTNASFRRCDADEKRPNLRYEEVVHPIQKGMLFLLNAKLALGMKATSGKGGVVQQGKIAGPMSVVHALCHEVFEEGSSAWRTSFGGSVALKERRFHCRRVREARRHIKKVSSSLTN
ncbi:Uncharacterized protein FKW44_000623 [Caligus rogercresseyi]|uniref:Uncharacterized protein n=1 Tax=Caligus rogercresseyi TaxID=217165 RepID=A0A7T8JTI1_CALRO|nr:Uncharacterized protein FKW44_025131 [Caligus rogercresseyi]QQP40102.1 Uncharacterized protein FKW44_014039 [Caligus rogercresseyi]QQP56071.1 Uncharacterized protein FKW44_000623 [Caligus rogercresseyi]|eukprot:TRINITY_DN499_c0_g1_i2.p1 TRINITY_DN499_c0_g1~~TRINITY_DN499_c0_g1_i2.p1  ORF type:complete len:143 (+),score=19.89 TRINITY_DN499_c0_g1_i2:1298-1726(+)